MSSNLPIIQQLTIAKPCPASWEDMAGDDRKRFCGHCQKNVYHLPNHTEAEIVALIVETEGRFCGRLFERKDGTVLTEDCPVGVRLARRAKRRALAVATLVATFFAAATAFVFRSVDSGWSAAPQPPLFNAPFFSEVVAGGLEIPEEMLREAKARQGHAVDDRGPDAR